MIGGIFGDNKYLLLLQISRIWRRFRQNCFCIEAGTLFYPFLRLYFAVMVQVGAEVAVTAEAGGGVVSQQGHDEDTEGVLLEGGAGIGGAAVFVQSAFVAEGDAVGVVATGVGTGSFDWAQGNDVAVHSDVIVITCAGESPAQVVCCQVVLRVAAVAAGGGAVDNDKIDESHIN